MKSDVVVKLFKLKIVCIVSTLIIRFVTTTCKQQSVCLHAVFLQALKIPSFQTDVPKTLLVTVHKAVNYCTLINQVYSVNLLDVL